MRIFSCGLFPFNTYSTSPHSGSLQHPSPNLRPSLSLPAHPRGTLSSPPTLSPSPQHLPTAKRQMFLPFHPLLFLFPSFISLHYSLTLSFFTFSLSLSTLSPAEVHLVKISERFFSLKLHVKLFSSTDIHLHYEYSLERQFL